MAGLARICKMYGSIIINGERWVWDYAKDEAVLESELVADKERFAASEKAKWKLMKEGGK